MRPRLLFAAPFVLAVWLASDLSCSRAAVPPQTARSTVAPQTARGIAAPATPAVSENKSELRVASASGPVAQSVTATPTAIPDVAPQAAHEGVAPVQAREGAASASAREASFAATVRPILLSHCAPCHEPGGRMYERLPFDRAETIASHSEGVLRRIKAPDERAAIEKWLGARDPS
jgi:hypothetical protein